MPTDEFDELEAQIPPFLTDPKGVVRRRWPWMLAVFLVTSIGATAFVATLPQTYQASGRLLLTQQRISEDLVPATSLERIPEVVNAVAGEVLSRNSLAEVAKAHKLTEGLSDGESTADLIARMRENITVEQDLDLDKQSRGMGEETFILAIRFEWDDPTVAADVANDLVDRFTAEHRRRQTRQARLTSEFLRKEADRTEKELAEQRAKITAFTEAHRGELPSELDTKLARLERLQQQSQSLALQISDAEGRLLILQSQEDANTQKTLLEELRARLVQERTIYTDEHPNVIAIRRQIEALEAEMAAAPRAGAGSKPGSTDPAVAVVQREVETLRAQAREVDQNIHDLDAEVSVIPARQEELLALQQREELLRDQFVDASRKVQEAELAESLQLAQQGFRVSRLDAAIPPPEPMRTRWKYAVLAAGAVLGLSAMVGLLLELADPVIVTARQLDAQTGILPLGVIPRIR